MDGFWLWFSTGLEHILDFSGYDHILFVTLLVFTYPFREWKKMALLVSAFTLGHCCSLALSVIKGIHIKPEVIEFLIALSILVSAIYNLITYKKVVNTKRNGVFIFLVVVVFGLIHGLGFSYLLRSMLGAEQNVLLPLLYFNLGLEAGQLIIVLIVILFSLLLASLIKKWPFNVYKLIIVCSIGLIALRICAQRFLELL